MYGSAADANVLPIVTITFLKILSFIRISLIQANTNLIYTVGDSNNISGQSWTEESFTTALFVLFGLTS